MAKEPVTGEHVIGVKTIAQGKPDQFGVPVVITLVCFQYFAREAAGALGTRLFLRPLSSWANGFLHSSGAIRVARARICVLGSLCPALCRASTFLASVTQGRGWPA